MDEGLSLSVRWHIPLRNGCCARDEQAQLEGFRQRGMQVWLSGVPNFATNLLSNDRSKTYHARTCASQQGKLF